jgi:large subunit ribosomal protein L23
MIHKYVLRDRQQSVSQEALYKVLRGPVVTEKATIVKEKDQYCFSVATWANKMMIRQAIEHIFSVKVKSINTLCVKGKTRRFRGRLGVRSDWKKAFVSLASGQVLNIDSGE